MYKSPVSEIYPDPSILTLYCIAGEVRSPPVWRQLPLLLDEPLLAWSEGGWVTGHVVPQLPASDDLGRAPVDVSERCVPVVEDSSGELVIVQTARLVSVVSDQLLGQLDSLLSSEVGVREVCTGESVSAAPQLEEVLCGGRCVAEPPITGQLLTGSVGLEVVAENLNQLLRPQVVHFVDTDPGAEPVHHDAVVVSSITHKITAYLLKWVVRTGQRCGWSCWLAGSHSVT